MSAVCRSRRQAALRPNGSAPRTTIVAAEHPGPAKRGDRATVHQDFPRLAPLPRFRRIASVEKRYHPRRYERPSDGASARTLHGVRWRVETRFGGEGLPMEAWAANATTLLQLDSAVGHTRVVACVEDLHAVPSLSVDVVVNSTDEDSAIARVEQAVMAALWQTVGEGEFGWMRHEWTPRRLNTAHRKCAGSSPRASVIPNPRLLTQHVSKPSISAISSRHETDVV